MGEKGMTLIEDQTLPAKKIKRDLEFDFIPNLINDLGELACDMANRGLLGRNSVADRGVYIITKKFSEDLTQRATQYFLEYRDATSTQAEYESFMNSLIEHIYLLMATKQFLRPPFEDWKAPLEPIKQEIQKRVKTEADIIFSAWNPKVTKVQAIKDKVKTIWHDPVISKVIASGIIALLGLLGGILYLYKDYIYILVQEK
jgi:hypothetical protein